MAQSQLLLEKYLIAELGITGGRLFVMIDKIKKYDDIFDEFCHWLEKRDYSMKNPLAVNGYTAKQIHELNPRFEGIGVYNFLIMLREDFQRAKAYMESGFRDL